MELCVGSGLWMGNIYFEHKSLHKCTRVARGQDEVEVKSIIDLVLVKKVVLHYMQDVRAVKEMGRGVSYHHVVLCKVRLVGTWIKRREVVNEARRTKSEKLREHQCKERYARSIENKRVE